MANQDKRKSLFYILNLQEQQMVLTHGMSFYDFRKATRFPLKNVLLLKEDSLLPDVNLHTMLPYATAETMPLLDKKTEGKMCWVDVDDMESVNTLTDIDIAHLLFLGHKMGPVRTPFSPVLHNRYAFLSQDDGFYTKIYYQKATNYIFLFGQFITSQYAKHLQKKRFLFSQKEVVPALSIELATHLFELSEDGLVLQFSETETNRTYIRTPLWLIGSYSNMDDMLDSAEEKKKTTSYSAYLVFIRRKENGL
ncbi:hypothetical protein G4V62_15875 [Bacillaceae bacterium SIJ1]|uniref:hypothetical protein n=1 Tax=Litoribacterium kuwaitense TaxID=1398745 RepID=UPI0013EA0DE2|nr:hypothetical protein [Litoribacterium kuwaitense]NGP46350.1 hypothetical protein [Litoribacterium kuwaitense]